MKINSTFATVITTQQLKTNSMNKTNRKWISQIVACSFLAMLPIGAYAQNNKTIHGVVKDANGETIIGASVGQKGTLNSATL